MTAAGPISSSPNIKEGDSDNTPSAERALTYPIEGSDFA